MANSKIEQVKTMLGMGARSNKYNVSFEGKGGGPTGEMTDVMVKSSAAPGRTITDVDVWVQGRLLQIAGDADYSGGWSCTWMDTEEHKIRAQFIAWMDFIDDFDAHSRSANGHSDYMVEVTVKQLSTIDNSVKMTYKMQNAYPKDLSEISYSDDSSDLIEFTTEWNYSHWTSA